MKSVNCLFIEDFENAWFIGTRIDSFEMKRSFCVLSALRVVMMCPSEIHILSREGDPHEVNVER